MGTNTESRLLTELWRELARKFGDVKFCEMRADLCIEGYPERNTPTILVYHKGDIVKQIVTLRELGGQSTTFAGMPRATFNSFDNTATCRSLEADIPRSPNALDQRWRDTRERSPRTST